ncbi:MAG TPA: CBS domain-containing protein [Solirubrobacteraceae bacterium]|nr:CBS domain-containing protein [Solirubrobacteraceae bacterium]
MPGGSYLSPSLQHATAADAMRPRVLTCTPDTPLITEAQRMAGEHVHALVVLRHDDVAAGRAWAVLTDRDVLRHAEDAEAMTAAARQRPRSSSPPGRATRSPRWPTGWSGTPSRTR